MKRLPLFLIVALFALALAACSAATEPTVAPTEAPMEEATEAPMAEPTATEEMMELKSIAEIAAGDANFTTLVTALSAAGLVETLSGDGQFTVFAPTNDAFAALPEGMLETLLADPQGALSQVLLYHVVEGAVPAETVVTLDSATTLQGEPVAIMVDGSTVKLNELVNVTTTDIEASNGIIHVIDGVLLPSTMAEASMSDSEMMGSVVDIATADGRFATLLAAVEAAGLAETLSGEGPFTVFAPTDDAFAALPEGTVESLLADPQGALTDILLYHVVDGQVMAADVAGLTEAVTLNGESIAIDAMGDSVTLNDTVKVIITDVLADNGVIHVIDAVLLPPTMAEASMSDSEMMGSIVDIASADGRFTTLLAAVEAAGLAETLSGEGPFTVFAPTDDAFAALPEGTVESLLADPQGALTDILLYHVLDGQVMAADVAGLTEATALNGKSIAIDAMGDSVTLNGTVKVIITDILADNGVIHVIDAVLLPPAE